MSTTPQQTTAPDDEQERKSRLLLLDETRVYRCSIEAPLAIELDENPK